MRLAGNSRLVPGNAVTRMMVGDTTSSRTLFATPAAGLTTTPSAILTYAVSGAARAAAAASATIPRANATRTDPNFIQYVPIRTRSTCGTELKFNPQSV